MGWLQRTVLLRGKVVPLIVVYIAAAEDALIGTGKSTWLFWLLHA